MGLFRRIGTFWMRLLCLVQSLKCAIRGRSQRKERLEGLAAQHLQASRAVGNLGLVADRWVKRKERKLYGKRYTHKRPFRRDARTQEALHCIHLVILEEINREISAE